MPADRFYDLARRLHDEGFDFLRSLTGMDWGEEGFGVVYHLESTATGENVVLRTVTPDRENPVLASVCDLWKTAELNEREAFDYFGIRFLNHPDMRRLFLRDDWVGYPLRKDYDPAQNPLRMSNEVAKDSTASFELMPDGSIIRKRNVLFEEEEYVINIGPQHPATHGVLRFRVSLEGEIIRKLDAHCGYIHRGIEKMCEELTYPQTLALTDRLDYLGAAQNRHALCMCIEKGLGMEVSERVKYIRTIMDELQRIDSHLLFFSCLCMDMGALTAFFYGFRDREKVLDILEQTTGGRLIQTYNTIGGVQADIHPDFVRKTKEFIAYMRPKLREYHEVFTGNVIAQERLKGTGVLTREDAISFGATGGTGRASGWACDVRKRHPYAAYDKVQFNEVLFSEGDCFARYMVRMREIEESMNIIEQLIDNIPEGEYQLKMKPVIRIPEGSYYAAVEGSRGEFGVFIESRGDKYPYRMKFRSTGLPLVACLETIARGTKIADLIAIGGTLDYVVPDIDR
ncbi:MAG TPA: NADH-quinone oxidoreductase subunit D [Candidatus Alistipes intestinigallinarum]|uniref:NADH-quinone oxidoreductase subunit D n=1 Tax=Candidatus Alistipes intestinigallinarum TaxID=2838440 RepID=A0A9D2CDP0_9BACT|nr:NADH-quinone oxidoreductase subunit D [Candidatus Alistipes intestinigallinarum]